MSHLDVLREVSERGLSLTVAGADLKLTGPKQRVDADLVGRIRAVKPELIEHLTAAQAARQNGYGLTLLQRGYLIGRGDTAPMGNVASHIYHEIDGCWDIDRLESALRMVVARHGMLRTCFTEEGEQVTEPEVDVRISRLDLRGLSEPEQQSKLAQLRYERSHRMLPIDRAPMIAVEITRLGARESDSAMRLHVSTDGLVLDGISMFMFFIDWHRCYSTGEPPTGDDVAFADYVAALEAARDQPQTRRSRDYWLDRLDDLPPHPGLPLAANPASIAKPRFTQYAAKLDPASWERLKSRAANAGLTPTVVLLAGYAEALARWGGGNRFTLATTIANRPPIHPNIAGALGNFSQTMLVEIGQAGGSGGSSPLASTAGGSGGSSPLANTDRRQSFTERARALQARMRRDLDHRHFSGIEVLRELARRDNGIDPAMPFTFNSTIGYLRDDVDGSAVDLFGPEIYTSSQTPQVWLNAFAFEYHGGVVVQVDAVDGLFPDQMIASMVDGYSELLMSLCTEEAWSATTFDLLPAEQRERRAAANDTATEPSESLVYEAFRAQAARTPDAPAVLTTSGSLTYGELAARATSAAAWLRARGAGRDELVGLIMRRGHQQIVGIMAAVLAGAAYLPVDAGLPDERIKYMLRDGRVRLVLSNVGWHAEGIQALDLRQTHQITGYQPPADTSADDLAYVLYTSGTTGEPKGVMISHRSVVNVVADCNRRFGVGPDDRFIGVSAFNFDLSVYDVFGGLSAGAAIVLPDADKAADPAHWLDLCDQFGVTIWNSVPAIAGLMAEEAGDADERLTSLRLVMMSGDRIPPALPAALWLVNPDIELMSLGGPTETTIWNISHPIDRAHSELEPVPYGRPNAGNRAYILDADGLDTPDWVTGEICAAGTGLARGYWADESRTAERFWFDESRGTRLYRTGDLGRYLPDGSIDIVGRSDFQIKVNGYRIEAGEVETRLAAIGAVKQAAVVRQAGARGDRLVAHLVPAGDARPTDDEIAVVLREHLPDYMTPSSVVWHDCLPLTRNGKVDRAKLIAVAPASAPSRIRSGEHPEIEAKLIELWASVLRLPTASIEPDSDFYELGGDSLAGARVFTGIRKQFGTTITLDRLYELRQLHVMADCVAGQR
ncbi:MAG TPA: amino acid adenylation domain-containing protein [Streptosporangiaceae bacterium]|nr:amino acid adenylation domain-containing protein [Streptosporangiaceae bacterium]